MTADELLSLAINVAGGWSLEDLGYGFDRCEAVRAMLADVNRQVIESNRLVIERLSKHKRSPILRLEIGCREARASWREG